MKRQILTVTAILALLGCNGSERGNNSAGSKPRLAYITNGVASFWNIAKVGAEHASKELGVDLTVQMPAEGISDQKRIVEDLLIRGVDGIAISLIDAGNQVSLVNDAAQRTKLITHDADAPGSERLAYVGMDNYKAGRMLGQLVKERLPQGGTLAILVGRVEQDNARKRRQGVIDEVLGRSDDSTRYDPPEGEITNGRYTFVTTLTDQFDRVKAKANCEDILLRYPNLSGVVGLFVYNSPLCLDVLKQTGKVGTTKVFAFDEADETLQAIQDGLMEGTVVQNPYEYGVQSVRLLNEIVKGNTAAIPPSKFIDIPARRIDQTNVKEFWDELREKLQAR